NNVFGILHAINDNVTARSMRVTCAFVRRLLASTISTVANTEPPEQRWRNAAADI
ncbi:unnamed protein product, partial [Rotaria magnacalcarata]